MPVINGDFIPLVQKEKIKKKYGSIDDTALNSKIAELQEDAECYASAFIGNINAIDDNSWIQIKKLYVEWMIYSQIEVESISKDKGDKLNKMLTSISNRINGKDEDNANQGIGLGMEIL